jgi:hypothetical protein
MKRILLVFAAAALLAGCGGGGGGGGTTTPTVPIPPNPGSSNTPAPGSTSSPAPGNTSSPAPGNSSSPAPGASNAPGTLIKIGNPGVLCESAVNPLPANATQVTTQTNCTATAAPSVARVTATGMTNGATLNSTISSNDKSGNTCLVYVPNGSSSGTPCTYPSAGSTPTPVTIKASGDGFAIQYNDRPMNPAGSITISGTNPGTGNVAPTSVSVANPSVAVGHNASNATTVWGGGIVYMSGNIYVTQNDPLHPIGVTSYSNGVAGSAVTDITASPALTNAPAGGLVADSLGNLWGTEQNNTKVFKMSTSGATTEYTISCPTGTAGGSAGAATQLGPQTGIAIGGGFVWSFCADVGGHTATNNYINQINPSTGTVTTCLTPASSGPFAQDGSFANGAIYSNGTLYTDEMNGIPGAGEWIAFPTAGFSSSCTISATLPSTGYGGNVWQLADGNLYSTSDEMMATTGFSNATTASPAFNFGGAFPGGGLVLDSILGSGYYFATSEGVDLVVNTKWSGGTQFTVQESVPLNAGGSLPTAGQCEVALNSGGGTGMVQLPDGKIAWPVATDGIESGRNWVCFANL